MSIVSQITILVNTQQLKDQSLILAATTKSAQLASHSESQAINSQKYELASMNNPTASEAGKESQISDNGEIDTLGQL